MKKQRYNKRIQEIYYTFVPKSCVGKRRFQTDILSLNSVSSTAADFDQPTEGMTDALPLLYQSGYLTGGFVQKIIDFWFL